MFQVELKLFGIFKEINSEHIFITLNKETPLIEFKKIVSNEFFKKNQFAQFEAASHSIFASEKEILPENFIINGNMKLAILPPVCGG